MLAGISLRKLRPRQNQSDRHILWVSPQMLFPPVPRPRIIAAIERFGAFGQRKDCRTFARRVATSSRKQKMHSREGKAAEETCREASSWVFKRPYFNDAQDFLRLLRQELLEFLEVFRLCFLARIRVRVYSVSR